MSCKKSQVMKEISLKLACHFQPQSLKKADELYRIGQTRNLSLGKYNAAFPYLCLNLACELNEETFPLQQVLQYLQIDQSQYLKCLAKARTALAVSAPDVSFNTVAVRLGATQLIPTAEGILESFKENYAKDLTAVQRKSFNWETPDLLVAIFYVCCKFVMKLGKREASALAPNPTQFNKFVQLVEEYCKEELKELKAGKKSERKTPKRTPSRKRLNIDIDDTHEEEGDGRPDEGSDKELPTPSMRKRSAIGGLVSDAVGGTPTKRARMGDSSAALPASRTPSGKDKAKADKYDNTEAISGINPMVNHLHIRQTKRYHDYLLWEKQILAKLSQDSIARAKRYAQTA